MDKIIKNLLSILSYSNLQQNDANFSKNINITFPIFYNGLLDIYKEI